MNGAYKEEMMPPVFRNKGNSVLKAQNTFENNFAFGYNKIPLALFISSSIIFSPSIRSNKIQQNLFVILPFWHLIKIHKC